MRNLLRVTDRQMSQIWPPTAGPRLDRILVVTDWLRLKMIHLLCFRININFVLGHGSWLGRYEEYGSYLAIFHLVVLI
jgi:hypothetical protein